MEIGRNTAFVILFVALLAVGAYLYVNTGSSGGQTISVSGNSEIDAQPDFVSIYVTIETLNASAQDSKDRNAEISEKVINALTRIGIDESDIETISYNLYEDFEWRNNGRESKGWKTTNQIKVKLEDYEDAGKVIDKAVDNGAFIQYINFELSSEKQNELKAQAIEEAAKDAKIKAEAAAKGSGRRLRNLVSLNTNEYYYRPYEYFAAASLDASGNAEAVKAATSISPQNLQVTSNVQAVYKVW